MVQKLDFLVSYHHVICELNFATERGEPADPANPILPDPGPIITGAGRVPGVSLAAPAANT